MLQLQSQAHLEVGRQAGGGGRLEGEAVPFQSLAAMALAVEVGLVEGA